MVSPAIAKQGTKEDGKVGDGIIGIDNSDHVELGPNLRYKNFTEAASATYSLFIMQTMHISKYDVILHAVVIAHLKLPGTG